MAMAEVYCGVQNSGKKIASIWQRAIKMGVGLLAVGMIVFAPPVVKAIDQGGAHAPPAKAQGRPKGPAAEADQLFTLPDFKVDMILKANPQQNGSWISMAVDPKGRLLLGGQSRQPITRVTIKDGAVEQQEVLTIPISECMGMLCANDSLYVNGNGKNNDGKMVFGMFKVTSTNHDDNWDKVEFLREWKGGSGEHGAHGIVLGQDKHLYVVCGNFTGLPADLMANSPHKNYQDDLALKRAEDGNGFGRDRKPPGGYVVRMDGNGQNPELYASGQRNTYDIGFNADGELFGFDSDMEWDWGTPWYRPIRVFHAVSGGDTGFREGTGKWPEYYFDSVPASSTIGVGCPTGVSFGTGAKFPAKYQKAFYILDWTYGRLIAVHLSPDGAAYKGNWENFVAPKGLINGGPKSPLNLTDVVIGQDGAMYFTVGGRGTQAALFRVTYAGTESTAPANLHDTAGADARAVRHQLESFHGQVNPKAVETVWPQLGSADRALSYAARIALESQPVAEWRSRAVAEKNPQAALTSLLALARLGGTEAQADVINGVSKFPFASLNEWQQFEKLRLVEVSIARQGKLSKELAALVIADLLPVYPSKSISLNRELAQIMLAINAPDAVANTMALLKVAPTQEEQLNYVLALRTITEGWTPALRQQYIAWWTNRTGNEHPEFVTRWFTEAGRDFANGSSFNNFLKNFHNDMQASLSADEKTAFAGLLAAFTPASKPNNKKPARVRDKLVKEWKTADLEPELDKLTSGRKFAQGKEVFEAAQCMACHKFGNEGGAIGPDLTAIASRFKHKDILESMTEPSKVVSDQYKNTQLRMKDGDVTEGKVIEENDSTLVLQTNPLDPKSRQTIKIADIKSRALSNLSPMPEGLINNFTKEEILDLIAYMESAGKKDFPAFQK